MQSKSLWMFIVAALFLLSCAAVEPNPTPLVTNYQTLEAQTSVSPVFNETPFFITPAPEQTLASRNQYYLEDIYDYDVFFVVQPLIKQMLISEKQYYLEDIYDYDVFFIVQPLIKQMLVSEKQYYLENIYDYDEVFFITQPIQTLASGYQYYLEDIYDYDNPSYITEIP